MLAKNWKRIGMLILIIACLFNVVSKLVKRVSFTDNVKSTVNNGIIGKPKLMNNDLIDRMKYYIYYSLIK